MVNTLVLGSASDSCNNYDITLVPGYNYNLQVAYNVLLLTIGIVLYLL